VTAANAASIPITTQITNFLNAGGSFGSNDLVYIQGGGNDFFFFQATGSNNNAILTTAANQLAQQVVRLQDAGAERIVTFAVQTGGAPGLQLFNQTYAAALAAANVNALYFDTDRLFNEIVASPGTFGITNITSTACVVPSSLACTPATYRTPNANETFLLADSVHPSGITQRIQGEAVASLLKAPEQIGQLSYAAQSLLRGQREILEGPMRGTLSTQGGTRFFGNAGYNYFSTGSSSQLTGLAERSLSFQLGADFALSEVLGLGIAGTYADGDGDFAGNAGGYDVKAWSGNVYGRGRLGPVSIGAAATYGSLDYDNIERRLALGPAVRTHAGGTGGDYLAASVSASIGLLDAAGIRIGPEAGLTYEKVELDGYSEDSDLSTAATFGDQRLKNLTGRIGLAATSAPGAAARVLARVSYEHEFNDDDRRFSITPVGAPISYTSEIRSADEGYLSYAMAVDGDLSPGVTVRGGVRGQLGRSDFDSLTSFVGLSIGF
jgi:outer membrane lipase/esterase